LKKLISTSYAADKKKFIYRNLFDESKDFSHGKIYTLEQNDLGKVDYPLKALNRWEYLEGDGDFRSAEVKSLRDEADVIITNPPFSMFREFLAWILEANKKFLIICNMNCITYKEVFPLIKENKIWLGNGFRGGDPQFKVPADYEERSTRFWIDTDGQKWRSFGNLHWLTNMEHGKRHENISLYMKYSPELYPRYDNYDAIEVSKTAKIPKDYAGVMGVPITFLDKYCPEQFEILGKIDTGKINEYNLANPTINGKFGYKRIAIRHKRR